MRAEWARDTEEDGDLASLVAMAMTREQQLQCELGTTGKVHSEDEDEDGGAAGRGRGASKHGELGVVEFGDAEDEPDWQVMARRGGVGGPGAAKQQHEGAASRSKGRGGAQQQQGRKPAGGAKMVAHKTGEMAHAGAPVPEEQRQVIFGDAGDVDAAPTDWEGLGLCGTLSEHLAALNFAEPTRVQRGALPALLAGRDAMVRAPTGSGKTLAYLAPIVQALQVRLVGGGVRWMGWVGAVGDC